MQHSEKQNSASALKKQVNALINTGQYASARMLCHRICTLVPDDTETLFMLGAIYGQLANWVEAEKYCRHAAKLSPHHPMIRYNLAIALLRQDKVVNAIDELEQAIALQPDLVCAHLELGSTFFLNGDINRAISQLTQTLALDPESVLAHLNIAHAFRDTSRLTEASKHYKRVIELDPDCAEAYCELGGVYIAQLKYNRAISLLKAAQQKLPGRPGVLNRLASAYLAQGDSDTALHYYNKILETDPDNANARSSIASIHALQGDFGAASEMLEKLLSDHPDHTDTLITFSRLAHKFDACDIAVQLVIKRLADPTIPEKVQSKLYFSLANSYARTKCTEKAFECYETANRLHSATFDFDSYSRLFSALANAFSHNAVPALPRSGNTSDMPIFIVGMPRSGTTLAEQILASHPDVYGAGELRNINYIVNDLNEILECNKPYFLCLDNLNAAMLSKLAIEYIDEITERSSGAHYVTDKMPLNFMHLGLIDLLFQNARIIHCKRDPLDTCLSCYFQDFSSEQPYAYSLIDLGRYYKLYGKLMAHWHKVLRVPVYDLYYETLVQNQEHETRNLLKFCDLEWDENCMHFHNTERTISTASFDQVRKPMYSGSIGRWRQYENHLGPLIGELHNLD